MQPLWFAGVATWLGATCIVYQSRTGGRGSCMWSCLGKCLDNFATITSPSIIGLWSRVLDRCWSEYVLSNWLHLIWRGASWYPVIVLSGVLLCPSTVVWAYSKLIGDECEVPAWVVGLGYVPFGMFISRCFVREEG